MRHDNGGPQLLEPTAGRLNRPTVQVQCPLLSGAEANPLFLDTLELVLEILEIVLAILETVLEILGIVLPCTFNFKAKRTLYSVKRRGNRVKILQSPTTCPGKGVAQRIPAQSVAVILSTAPGFSSTASSHRKIWKDGVTRRIPKSHIKNMCWLANAFFASKRYKGTPMGPAGQVLGSEWNTQTFELLPMVSVQTNQ